MLDTTKITLTPYKTRMRSGLIRKGLIVKGDKHLGEIAPLPAWSTETYQEAKFYAEKYLKDLEKGDTNHYYPPSVLFGMDTALNRQNNPNIIELLQIGDTPTKKEIKIKVPDITDIMPIKELTDKGYTIRLDFNRAHSLKNVIAFCKHFKPNDFLYIEDPVPNFSDLIPFYEATGFPFALDEHLLYHPLERILPLPGLTHLIIKPTLHGGLKQCAALIKKGYPKKVTFSSAYESSIGLNAIASLNTLLNHNAPLGIDTLKLIYN